jgi:hypothetical protein
VKAEVKTEATPEEVTAVAEVTEAIPVGEEKIVIGQITIDEEELDEEEVMAEAEEEPAIEEEEELAEEETPVAVAEAPKEETETLLFEPVAEEVPAEVKEEKKAEPKQISFDDLLGNTYQEPEFVKVNEVPKEVEKAAEITFEKVTEVLEEPAGQEVLVEETSSHRPLESIRKEIEAEKAEYKALSLNDKFNKTITLGLNDRIAFEKHLFGGSGEDLNRVLSQLNTFNTLEEAKSFIDDLVKPDYNDWQGKDEYSSRFLELVEKKFA